MIYTKAKLKVVTFNNEDIITTSGAIDSPPPIPGEPEVPIVWGGESII